MITVNTIEDISLLFQEELKGLYPKGEIEAFVILTANHLLNIPSDEVRARRHQSLTSREAERIYSVAKELKTQRPIQYILGRTDFYSCKIRVDENVLIPRPETEELVDFILSDSKKNTNPSSLLYKKELNIIDIGTGSGCIAIALKKNLPDANVSAIDISEEALLTAKANAILNQTMISFLQADILGVTPNFPLPKEKDSLGIMYDIIVSNPPYVCASEKEKMDKNVLDFEPHLALFVNDNDPLIFYKAIADFALTNLSTAGKLYFEINEALGSEVKKLLEEKGFKNAEVKKDMSGKERIAVASKA